MRQQQSSVILGDLLEQVDAIRRQMEVEQRIPVSRAAAIRLLVERGIVATNSRAVTTAA